MVKNKIATTNTFVYFFTEKKCNVGGIANKKLNKKCETNKIKAISARDSSFYSIQFCKLFSSGCIFSQVTCGNGRHGEVIATCIAHMEIGRSRAMLLKQIAHVAQANTGDVI